MACTHLLKMAFFFHELRTHKGRLKASEQSTYSYYTNRRKFWKTIKWYEDKNLVVVNNQSISLTFKGDFIAWILEDLFNGELNELQINP